MNSTIPREVLERLEVFPPASHAGHVHIICVWDIHARTRVRATEAALAPYFPPGTRFTCVQALQEDRYDRLRQAFDAIYANPPEPAQDDVQACNFCGETGDRLIQGRAASICARCATSKRAVPPAGAVTCDFCDLHDPPGPARADGECAICAGCLDLVHDILAAGDDDTRDPEAG